MSEKRSDITVFGGDCNFCFSSEVNKASKIVSPEYYCVTYDLGTTFDSYYTESHLPYFWVYMNNFLRKLGLRMKLKTDHFFVDKKNAKRSNIKTEILSDRVSDHIPIEIVLEINGL